MGQERHELGFFLINLIKMTDPCVSPVLLPIRVFVIRPIVDFKPVCARMINLDHPALALSFVESTGFDNITLVVINSKADSVFDPVPAWYMTTPYSMP